ncbi:MAG: DUF1611 domain-containing protein [bacterium]
MIDFRRAAILAEGKLGILTSKTAACLIKYQPHRVACVIDSTKAGRNCSEVLGFGGEIAIVASIEQALAYSPDVLLIGIAPRGGLLPPEWRSIVLKAVRSRLGIVSGLHTILEEDEEIFREARKHGVHIWDVRKSTVPDGVLEGKLSDKKGKVILTVGSDSRTGKMTVAYELAAYLNGKGVRARFVATGQTGIILAGFGTAIDRVPGDFMSRVVEDLTYQALVDADVAVVEGQGSIVHPAYSGVALAIIHGCRPDAMIMCHQPSRLAIEGYDVEIPSLRSLIKLHEGICAPLFDSRVVALALNTFDLDEKEAKRTVEMYEKETGLVADDVVRWGCDKISRAIGVIL